MNNKQKHPNCHVRGRHSAAMFFIAVTSLLVSNIEPLSAKERPNVLLIFVDDLKPMTLGYGQKHMHTPNFTRLANFGLRFTNAYCQVPTCGASRASLMTSLYPTETRFPDFQTKAELDAPNHPTLAQKFREAGYHTISNGKVFHHHRDTEERSWSEPAWKPALNGRSHYNKETTLHLESIRKTKEQSLPLMFEKGEIEPLATTDGQVTSKTIEDLERLASKDSPFFIAMGFAKPHMPFYSPVESYNHYPLKKIDTAKYRELPKPLVQGGREATEQFSYLPFSHDFSRILKYNSNDYHRHMRQGYYASVSHADCLLGKILDKVEALQLLDNTIIAVIGDHGFLLGEHSRWAKNRLLPEALRTAMWIAGPGVESGQEVKTFVEFVDIYPTLCELAGIELENQIVHGESFTHLLKNPTADHRKFAYTRFEKGDAISSKDYFFASYLDSGSQHQLLISHKADPLAKVNCSGAPSYQQVKGTLIKQIAEKVGVAEKAYPDPLVSQKSFEVSATIDHPKPHGVVLAHGGMGFGYALAVVDQKPLVALRNAGDLIQIQSEETVKGRVDLKADLSEEWLRLFVNGREVARQQSTGLLLEEPREKFSHSRDAGSVVGNYPNTKFTGRILSYSVRSTTP